MAKLANKLGDDSEFTSKGRRRSYVPCILQLALHELGLNGWCTCATDTGGSTASLVCERNIDSRQCARCPENVVLATNVASDGEGDTSQAAIACGINTDVTGADSTQTSGKPTVSTRRYQPGFARQECCTRRVGRASLCLCRAYMTCSGVATAPHRAQVGHVAAPSATEQPASQRVSNAQHTTCAQCLRTMAGVPKILTMNHASRG